MYIRVNLDYGVNLIVEYENKYTDLFKDRNLAQDLAVELLIPEIDTILIL